MPIIVLNCHHCDKQQFQTLSCVHYTIFSVITLDLFIRALLLDRILALEKNYAYASCTSCSYCINTNVCCLSDISELQRPASQNTAEQFQVSNGVKCLDI